MFLFHSIVLILCALLPHVAPLKPPISRISPLIDSIAVSKTIEIHSLTKDMEAKGQVVYSLCVGEPDYQPPNEVVSATAFAASNGLTKYTGVTGIHLPTRYSLHRILITTNF